MRTKALLGVLPVAVLLGGCRWIGVGDSILAGQQPALEQRLGSGKLNAVPARGPAPEVVEDLVGLIDEGEWIIMQEDGGQATPESYRAYVDQVVEITPDDRCVLWVMPFSKWYQERDALFREQITEGLQAQPCHATVPWHEAAGAAGAQLMRDGLHPNEAGKAWLVDAIADTIDEAAADAES